MVRSGSSARTDSTERKGLLLKNEKNSLLAVCCSVLAPSSSKFLLCGGRNEVRWVISPSLSTDFAVKPPDTEVIFPPSLCDISEEHSGCCQEILEILQKFKPPSLSWALSFVIFSVSAQLSGNILEVVLCMWLCFLHAGKTLLFLSNVLGFLWWRLQVAMVEVLLEVDGQLFVS